ncbi:S1 family peptidase [Antrihabitans cavernicola]|uniref:S1 family peptidase n=1 Tax=Antrihabitans cavernicola TaxID=2495913 RepID=A0A5A7S430_9NOCA|nr:S1 family peptidase [Spelaeibacter cavernicola]KAA0018934.1 S1 family peptidase [Spelaeibacter cavernicola]
MRRSIARKAALFGSTALLLLGPTTAIAQADPGTDPGVSDQAAHLPIELTQALQHDLQLTPDQYIERSELAQKLGEFASIARIQYPDAFAGSWLDDQGKAIVALAGPNAGPARAAAQAAGFGVKDVARSEASLNDQLTAFDDWLRGQPTDVAKLVRGAAVDLLNNTLSIRVQQVAGGVPLPGFLDPFQPRVLVTPPAVGPEKAPTKAADIAAATPDSLEGGDAYAALAGDNSLRCSLGFNGTDAAGRVVNITAGHCDPNLAAAGTADATPVHAVGVGDSVGPKVGSFEKTVLNSHDYALIGIDEAAKTRFQNNLVRVPGQAPVAIDGVAQPVVGAPVCKSGSRTGFSCGTINSVGQSVTVGDRTLNDAFSTTICALPGDSGGAIITGTKALGVSSASSVADAPFCAIPELIGSITGDTPILFATTLNVVLAENPGLQVRTS